MFDMIGLSCRPSQTHNSSETTFDRKNELAILGLGAIDDMKLNTGMEDMKRTGIS
ncbi:MAG: hypothetical protein ACLR6J_05820 [Parabacteroides merdae]